MKLSQLLDPRRMAAERDARAEADADADAEGAWLAEAAKAWAKEDAAALTAQIADMAELRQLAMGLARAAAVAEVAGLEAVAPEDGEGAGDRTPAPSGACASRRDTAPINGGGAKRADTLFGRYARMARLTALLETRLRGERRALAAGAADKTAKAAKVARGDAEDEGPEPILDPALRAKLNLRLMRLVCRKQTIVGVVREILADAGHDEETREDVGRLLGERLLDWEPSDTVEYPIGRMVLRACRRLGVVPPDWSKFKDRDWAVEEAEAMAEGSPFGDLRVEPAGWRGGVVIPHPDDPSLWGDEADGAPDPRFSG